MVHCLFHVMDLDYRNVSDYRARSCLLVALLLDGRCLGTKPALWNVRPSREAQKPSGRCGRGNDRVTDRNRLAGGWLALTELH